MKLERTHRQPRPHRRPENHASLVINHEFHAHRHYSLLHTKKEDTGSKLNAITWSQLSWFNSDVAPRLLLFPLGSSILALDAVSGNHDKVEEDNSKIQLRIFPETLKIFQNVFVWCSGAVCKINVHD